MRKLLSGAYNLEIPVPNQKGNKKNFLFVSALYQCPGKNTVGDHAVCCRAIHDQVAGI